jgi:uncharacterized protein
MEENFEGQPVATTATPWLARVNGGSAVQAGTVTFGRNADLFFAAAIALAIPWLASVVMPLASPLLPMLDPERYWLPQTVHQIGALALTLLVIRLVSRRRLADWGLNLRHAGLGISMAAGFALVVSVPIYFLMDAAPPPTTPITPWVIVAVLTTHLLVIGTTQEVLYRGFVMGFLENRWPKVYRFAGMEMPVRGLIAAVIFMLSHVKPYPPFVWPMQLVFSLVYGVLYALMYHRTRSLLGPALAHGYSNTAYVAMVMLKYT